MSEYRIDLDTKINKLRSLSQINKLNYLLSFLQNYSQKFRNLATIKLIIISLFSAKVYQRRFYVQIEDDKIHKF